VQVWWNREVHMLINSSYTLPSTVLRLSPRAEVIAELIEKCSEKVNLKLVLIQKFSR
jgi:hypothetical protein